MRFLLLSLFISLTAMGNVPGADFEFLFNRLPGQPLARKYALGTVLREAHLTQVCVYDYDTLGGSASADITLKNTDLVTNCQLPAKSIVLNGVLKASEDVTATGGAATLKIQTDGANGNLLASTTVTSAAPVQLIPDWATIGDSITVGSSAVNVEIRATSGTLTAGRFRVFLQYVQGE